MLHCNLNQENAVDADVETGPEPRVSVSAQVYHNEDVKEMGHTAILKIYRRFVSLLYALPALTVYFCTALHLNTGERLRR